MKNKRLKKWVKVTLGTILVCDFLFLACDIENLTLFIFSKVIGTLIFLGVGLLLLEGENNEESN